MAGAIEMLERGSLNSGPASGCARNCGACPVARFCRPQNAEANAFVVKSITELLKKPELPKGIIYFSPAPVRSESGEAPVRTGEKNCSICKEPASTCSHSGLQKR